MKTLPAHGTFLLALTASFVATDLCAQRNGRRRGQREAPAIELEHFDYRTASFASENLEDEGQYGVYLPKGWDAEGNETKYPLVVWLHGFGGFDRFMGSGGAATLDRLRSEEKIPEMVVIAFRAPGGRRSRSAYLDGERSGNVSTAISVDLVAHAVETYPVDPSPSRHGIMGVSLGGFGALRIAMKHPERFAAVGAHSAAVFPDDPEALPERDARRITGMIRMMGLNEMFGDPIDKKKWAAEMPMGLARAAEKDTFSSLAIYFDAGTEDRYGFALPNVDLSEILEAKEIPHTFRLVDGGGHAWGSASMVDNLGHKTNQAWAAKIGVTEHARPIEEELGDSLAEAERAEVCGRTNRPAQILALQSRHLASMRERGWIDDFRHMEMEKVLVSLLDLQGRSERIKNFPYPRQYATLNAMLLWIFLWLLPFGVMNEFARIGSSLGSVYPYLSAHFLWFSVPFSVIVMWVFHTMERIGRVSENPFEGTPNDVPITTMARGIEIDLLEMLGEPKSNIPAPVEPRHHVQS